MRVDRIEKLEKFILDNKTASLDSLCERFDVSKNTLRRDIDALCERGNIKKVYGGVVAVEKGQAVGLKPFKERSAINSELKLSIAEKTSKMINDGDTLFIDTGSSTFPLVNLLKNLKDITIVTNSVPFIYHAMAYDNLNIIALPGTL
nr:DeoR/GlpR family DNA-binding transcription regulator [Lachnospiraceae bacterium]